MGKLASLMTLQPTGKYTPRTSRTNASWGLPGAWVRPITAAPRASTTWILRGFGASLLEVAGRNPSASHAAGQVTELIKETRRNVTTAHNPEPVLILQR